MVVICTTHARTKRIKKAIPCAGDDGVGRRRDDDGKLDLIEMCLRRAN